MKTQDKIESAISRGIKLLRIRAHGPVSKGVLVQLPDDLFVG
jgi:hypothetical protein